MTEWVVEPLWKGERVFVIGGGQSAKKVLADVECLPNKTIAIKDAAFMVPAADVFFYADRRLHKERPDVWNAYLGKMRVKRTPVPGTPAGVLEVRRQAPNRFEINGLSLDPALLGGYDSGGSAINLAFHLGAREIILIGFDLKGRHWNPDHPLRAAPAHIHTIHRRSIEAMAAPLKRAGVRVFNTSKISSLKEYPYADLRDVVRAHFG